MQETHYPVWATVQHRVDEHVSKAELPFETVAAASKELYWVAQDVLALRVDLSSSDNVPAEDLACLFQLEMCHMTDLYLGAEPPADDSLEYDVQYTTHQWPVEYAPGIDIEDRMRLYPNIRPPFTYAHFLYGLQLWLALERVEIRSFLHIPTADKDHIPSLDPGDWILAMHRNLKTFVVEDIPSRVQFLLGYVYIPANVDIRLTAANKMRSFEADMVQEMVAYLPIITKGVRMLDEATHVHIEVGPESLLQLCGKVSRDEDESGRLVLAARPNSASAFDSHRARGEFLYCLLHFVPRIFETSIVNSLDITGDVTYICSKDDWANLLRPFQNLRTLRAKDYAWGRYGPVSALCQGLTVTSYGPCHGFGDPICPRLTRLDIADAEYSESGIKTMYKALEFRSTHGHPIAHCVCGFRVRGNVASSRLQRAVDTLSTVVEDVLLENQFVPVSYAPTRKPKVPPADPNSK